MDDAIAGRAHVFEAEVIRGGCGGDVSLYRAEARIGEAAARPPELGPGRYGLRARVRDDGCTWFAAGCLDTMLPLAPGATVEVEITALATTEALCPAGVACVAGECDLPDAGMMEEDAGDEPDAG